MIVAVSSKGPTLKDSVDPRFGRAAYILIVDADTGTFEAIDNSANINAFKGAGIQTATMISDRGAEALLTGYCGPNAFRTLQAGGIKVVSDVSGTIEEAIQRFRQGALYYSNEPNAQGHW